MKKIFAIILLLLSLLPACDVLNGVYSDRWTDITAPVYKTGAGPIGGYTLVAGEDGHADMQWGTSWPSPRFTNPDGTTPISGNVIKDQMTGMMWTKNANLNSGTLVWVPALTYISGTVNVTDKPGGYSDWRLPNARELASLINYGESDISVWLNNTSQGFINVQSNQYWTSTTSASASANAWYIHMGQGYIYNIAKTTSYYTWPVRGNETDSDYNLLATGAGVIGGYTLDSREDGSIQKGVDFPAKSFYDNGDGTMTDRKTGLMWTKDANIASGTWPNALTYITTTVNTSTKPGGYTDWRLPNINELKTMIHYGKTDSGSWLNTTQGFTNVQSNYYWSSTTNAGTTANAWYVHLGNNYTGHVAKTNSYYVWPVRGGQR